VVGARARPGKLEDRREDVRDAHGPLDLASPAAGLQEESHVDLDVVEGVAVALLLVLAELLSVVRDDDDHRVVVEPALAQEREQRPDLPVEKADLAVVPIHLPLGPLGIRARRQGALELVGLRRIVGMVRVHVVEVEEERRAARRPRTPRDSRRRRSRSRASGSSRSLARNRDSPRSTRSR